MTRDLRYDNIEREQEKRRAQIINVMRKQPKTHKRPNKKAKQMDGKKVVCMGVG